MQTDEEPICCHQVMTHEVLQRPICSPTGAFFSMNLSIGADLRSEEPRFPLLDLLPRRGVACGAASFRPCPTVPSPAARAQKARARPSAVRGSFPRRSAPGSKSLARYPIFPIWLDPGTAPDSQSHHCNNAPPPPVSSACELFVIFSVFQSEQAAIRHRDGANRSVFQRQSLDRRRPSPSGTQFPTL